MSNIIPFDFEGAPVRIIMRDGSPWFVLADVCRVLDHSNPSMAAKALDDDERDTLNIAEGIHRGPGNPNVAIINESGLYSLILASRKEAARRFRKWVTAEVIPAIRKTGSYISPPANEIAISSQLQTVLAEIVNLRAEVATLRARQFPVMPKLDMMDVTLRKIDLQTGSYTFTELLREWGVAPDDARRKNRQFGKKWHQLVGCHIKKWPDMAIHVTPKGRTKTTWLYGGDLIKEFCRTAAGLALMGEILGPVQTKFAFTFPEHVARH